MFLILFRSQILLSYACTYVGYVKKHKHWVNTLAMQKLSVHMYLLWCDEAKLTLAQNDHCPVKGMNCYLTQTNGKPQANRRYNNQRYCVLSACCKRPLTYWLMLATRVHTYFRLDTKWVVLGLVGGTNLCFLHDFIIVQVAHKMLTFQSSNSDVST